MDWDDLNDAHYDWPSVQEIRNYRALVKDVVLKVIDKISPNIDWNSDAWVIMNDVWNAELVYQNDEIVEKFFKMQYWTLKSYVEEVCELVGKSMGNEKNKCLTVGCSVGRNSNGVIKIFCLFIWHWLLSKIFSNGYKTNLKRISKIQRFINSNKRRQF